MRMVRWMCNVVSGIAIFVLKRDVKLQLTSWMCNVKVKARVPRKELGERLAIDDIILIPAKQVAMVWACVAKRRHWLGEEMYRRWRAPDQEVDQRGLGHEVVQKDCQARNLNTEDAMDRSRWKNLIKTGHWSGWWVGECFFLVPAHQSSPGQRAVKRLLLLLFVPFQKYYHSFVITNNQPTTR